MNRKSALNNGITCKHDGCTHKSLLKMLKHHEAMCEYGPQTCPIFHCEQSVILREITQHCLTYHGNMVAKKSNFTFIFDKFKENFLNKKFEGLRYLNIILFVYDELFITEFSYSKSTGLMRWGVNYLDKKKDCRFYFLLSFIGHKDVYREKCMPFYKDDFTDSIGCQISVNKMASYCGNKGQLGIIIEVHPGEVCESKEMPKPCLKVEKVKQNTEEVSKSLSELTLAMDSGNVASGFSSSKKSKKK